MTPACSRCGSDVGCIDCSPQTMKLRAEIRQLRSDLESANRRLASACWPKDHEKEDLPEEVVELQKKLLAADDRWESAKSASIRVRQDIRLAYSRVIAEGKASKKGHVFQLGVSIGKFIDDVFG